MPDKLFGYSTVQKFNETEMELYKYILANAEKTVYMTIRELAKATHVSTSTVLRFCEKTGCDGYAEFREKMRERTCERNQYEPGSDIKEILDYFERTYTGAFEETIDSAVDMIAEADTVVFVGMGGSGILARYGARFFSNYGKFSFSIEDPYYPILDRAGEKMLIIALSVTGESDLLIEQLKDCQKLHCRILSITNSSDSTVARMSDMNISYCMELRRDGRDSNDSIMKLSQNI